MKQSFRLVMALLVIVISFGGMAFAQNPTVTGIAVVDSTDIDVSFSKAMGASALTATHYSLSGSGKGTLNTNPDAAALLSGNTYRVTWNSGNMTDHHAITITVTGVSDSLGNGMGSPNSDTLPTGAIGVAPVVSAVAAFDSQHIDVTFNEPMGNSALTTGHYSLSGSGKGSLRTSPDSVAAQSQSTYRLGWTDGDMLNGADITITATGTADAAGNSQDGPSAVTAVGGAIGTLPTISSVTVIDGSHVDVTFSEAMDNGSDVRTAGSYALSGSGRGTLSATPTSVASRPLNTYRLGWTAGNMFNGGDVTITVSGGTDLVGNPIGDSNSATHLGGGIGVVPTISAFTVDDATRMSITFSEPVSAGVLTAANYTLSGAGRGSFSAHPDSVALRSNSTYRLNWNSGEMVNGAALTVTVANVTDSALNPMGNPDFGGGLGIGTPPTVLAFTPAANSVLQLPPSSVQVTFTEPIVGIVAADISIAGAAATDMTGSGAGPYTFTGYTGPADGVITVALATDAITDVAGNPFAGFTWNITVDSGSPTSSASVLKSARAGTTTLTVNFTASDAVSGVANTTLFVKTPGSDSFVDSGLNQPGTSGAFTYASATANGLYQFATRATDVAGNSQPDLGAPNANVLLNTVLNGPFTQTVVTGADTLLFPMTDDIVISVALTGAAPDGQITVSRATPIRATAPAYFGNPRELLDESLTISSNNLGAFTGADVRWPVDAANLPKASIDTVWQFAGESLDTTYASSFGGNVLTVGGVTSFGTWYAGNTIAVPPPPEVGWILW